jgi:steroid delta-isomerase
VPTTEELRQLVDRYCAVTSSGAIDDYVALFAEDAVQLDPASAPPHIGHDAIRAFRQSAVDAAKSMRFEALAVHTAANHVAIDFRVTVELDAGRMIIQGIEVFTVADDGLISAVSAYWDDADITFA